MSLNLDIDLVRTFVITADHASMTAAANARYLTQSAVSQQVKRLEDKLRCLLFERDRRGLRLTPAGEQLLPKARRLLSLNDEIWSEMTAATVSGKVRIGVPYDLVGTSMAPILKAYAEAYPRVEISLLCASSPELLSVLANGKADLVVVEEPVGELVGECLRVERLVWVGARGGAAHRKDPLPVSMVADSCAFRPSVVSALEAKARAWRTVFESGNIEATTATVRTDLAVTAWLACTVPSDLEILGAEADLPDLPPFAISLHVPKRKMTAAAAEMARYVRDGMTRQQQAASAASLGVRTRIAGFQPAL
jgi:DNA-binding transcriptional LysR family regulator